MKECDISRGRVKTYFVTILRIFMGSRPPNQ